MPNKILLHKTIFFLKIKLKKNVKFITFLIIFGSHFFIKQLENSISVLLKYQPR